MDEAAQVWGTIVHVLASDCGRKAETISEHKHDLMNTVKRDEMYRCTMQRKKYAFSIERGVRILSSAKCLRPQPSRQLEPCTVGAA